MRHPQRSTSEGPRFQIALAALARCVRALITATSEKSVLEEVCAIIVEAGYRFCWIGAAEQDKQKTVRPLAWAGLEDGYLSSVKITWSDSKYGRGPVGTSIRTGQPAVYQDAFKNPCFSAWRTEARKRGYRSVCSLPLIASTVPFGALNIYAHRVKAFGENELQLLADLAEMLSFGITNLRERKRTEDKLQEVSELNEQVIQGAQEGIAVCDQELRCQLWNPFVEELMGVPAREMVGGFPLEKSRILRTLGVEAGWRKALAGEPNVGDDIPLTLPHNGRTVWISGRHTPLRDASGQVTKVLVTLRDITERKKAEDELRQSEQRLGQVIRVSQIGIFDHDQFTDTTYCSPELRNIYGFGKNEVVPLQVFLDHVYADDREAIVAAVRRAHDPAGDGLFAVEHRIVRRDGTVRWLSTRSQTSFDGKRGARRPVRTIGAVFDITERKHAERALREAEEKYREIFDQAVLGIFQSTPEGRYLSVNQALARMYGYSSPQEMMTVVTDIERQAYVQPSRRQELRHLLEEQGVVRDFVFEFPLEDGSQGWAMINARAVRDAQGKVEYFEGTQEDITERKRLEAQYQQAQKMEAVGRLAGGVAHDFNNILSVILGYSEISAGQLASDHPVARNISRIRQAAERAASLTRQLLTFSRQQVAYPRVLDLNEVVVKLSEMLKRVVGEDVTISLKLDEQLGLVKADLGQMEQILMNLAVNSRDAMPTGGRISIETKNVILDENFMQQEPPVVPGSYVLLSSGDTGCGIDKENLSRIFEPFFTTKGPGKGTGLGLATVYGIVKQSNGYIQVYTERNRGTIFKIYFPRVEDTKGAVEPKFETEAEGGTETILLVEDEPALREVAATMLKASGYRILQAESATAALALAQASGERIDLLLTDVIMPAMSGPELSDRLQESRREIKVLYTSGYAGDWLSHYGQFDSEKVLLEKPFTKNSLLKKVRSVLDS